MKQARPRGRAAAQVARPAVRLNPGVTSQSADIDSQKQGCHHIETGPADA